jgi:hypothetical protein
MVGNYLQQKLFASSAQLLFRFPFLMFGFKILAQLKIFLSKFW